VIGRRWLEASRGSVLAFQHQQPFLHVSSQAQTATVEPRHTAAHVPEALPSTQTRTLGPKGQVCLHVAGCFIAVDGSYFGSSWRTSLCWQHSPEYASSMPARTLCPQQPAHGALLNVMTHTAGFLL
jgi:hypothetical protein